MVQTVDKPYKLGLTGSIGMGKSTTAAMFADEGVPIWDADSAVAALYGPDAAGSRAIAALAPDAVGPDGVNRATLRAAIQADSTLLPRIEAAIHPLLATDRAAFLARHADAAIVLFDLPLLFETGADSWLDGIVVVSTDAETQRARVLARPGMSEDFLQTVLARQMPDAEKRARATWVIDTGRGLDHAREAVLALLARFGKTAPHA